MSTVVRQLLKGFPEKDPNPSLQDLLHDDEPPFIARTEIEERIGAMIPGDDVESHPLYMPPNPYTYMPYSELLVLARSGKLKGNERKLVMQAMERQQNA